MFSPPKPMMREYCERNEEGTGPVLDEEEGEEVVLKCPEVVLSFSPETREGLGDLTITNMRIVWLSSEDPSKAFDLDVAYICLHAISKDTATFPTPCIYCQLAEEEEDVLKEAFFSPNDSEVLQTLFEAFSRAAEMNPDPLEAQDDDDGEDNDGGLMFGGDGASSAEQERVLAHLDSVLIVPESMRAHEGQFEDAEDDGEEAANEDRRGDVAVLNGHHDANGMVEGIVNEDADVSYAPSS